jgi:exodeoxyribonuclease VII small subunit
MTQTEAASGKAKSAAKSTAKKASKAQTAFNFEQSLEQLEELVSSMEEGELSLEDSLAAFERGIKLTRECQAALKDAEQKVQVLLDESGATRAMSADGDEDDAPF